MTLSGTAALGAAPAMSCITVSLRITVPPGTGEYSALGTCGPALPDPVVTLPGIISGIYST